MTCLCDAKTLLRIGLWTLSTTYLCLWLVILNLKVFSACCLFVSLHHILIIFLLFQLYIIFPVLVRTMTANSFSLRIFTVCKTESLKFPMLKPDQVIFVLITSDFLILKHFPWKYLGNRGQVTSKMFFFYADVSVVALIFLQWGAITTRWRYWSRMIS